MKTEHIEKYGMKNVYKVTEKNSDEYYNQGGKKMNLNQTLEEKLESIFKRTINWMKGSGARFYRTTPEKLPSELFWGEYLCELKWEAYQLFCETLYPEEEDVTEFMFDDEHKELQEWFENRLIHEQQQEA